MLYRYLLACPYCKARTALRRWRNHAAPRSLRQSTHSGPALAKPRNSIFGVIFETYTVGKRTFPSSRIYSYLRFFEKHRYVVSPAPKNFAWFRQRRTAVRALTEAPWSCVLCNRDKRYVLRLTQIIILGGFRGRADDTAPSEDHYSDGRK